LAIHADRQFCITGLAQGPEKFTLIMLGTVCSHSWSEVSMVSIKVPSGGIVDLDESY
jgi:hypothetical protein